MKAMNKCEIIKNLLNIFTKLYLGYLFSSV